MSTPPGSSLTSPVIFINYLSKGSQKLSSMYKITLKKLEIGTGAMGHVAHKGIS